MGPCRESIEPWAVSQRASRVRESRSSSRALSSARAEFKMWHVRNRMDQKDTHDSSLRVCVNWVVRDVRDMGHGRAPCLPSSLPSQLLQHTWGCTLAHSSRAPVD